MLLKVVDEVARASTDVGDQREAAGASAHAPDQENDQKASPPKQAKTRDQNKRTCTNKSSRRMKLPNKCQAIHSDTYQR